MRPSLHARRNFFFISCVVLAEPVSSTVLLPFIYFMVKGFGYSGGEIGFRAGIITSSFFVVQMFSNPIWSLLSDRVGRKPCLVLGLLGTAVSMVAFGMSPNLTWAIASRSMCGLMNGNSPIARTVVGELSEATGMDKAKAFSLFGFCLAAGWTIGPLIGGTLADPTNHFGLQGPYNVLKTYPWLLPCLFIAVYNVVVVTLTCIYMDETSSLTSTKAIQENHDRVRTHCETDPLLSEHDQATRESSHTSNDSQAEEMDVPRINFRRIQGLSMLTAICYFIHIICFDELFPLFAASSLEVGIGLSFNPRDIARALLFAGPAMFGSLLVFSTLHRRYGSRTLYRSTAVVFTIVYPLFSMLPHLAGSTGGSSLWILLTPLVMLRYAAMVIGLASIQIIFNDVAAPSERAFLNGLAQSVGSFARAIGPTLGGTVWSWSVSNGLPAPLEFHATVGTRISLNYTIFYS
ncbi:major facilitator superfamily domain-containing protein [Pseudomassariella vexata]|uniref:Major facilitator superfamily domain-containing protein n=1 Tax=Pseudomassariella vexata TaxID=1141098 RepID=A0A1Y2DHP1_9PEZI|nr:major facilitator superfamily domain-containing protein [Pseudomassariella vexata]ORY58748.1 major facilitator superfamily domain-containing protein [Pseudomassariella vexata]